MSKRKITQSTVRRIQRATTVSNGGVTPKEGFKSLEERISNLDIIFSNLYDRNTLQVDLCEFEQVNS